MARLNLIVGDAQARLVVRGDHSSLTLAGNFTGNQADALLQRVLEMVNGFQGRLQVSLAGCLQLDPRLLGSLLEKQTWLEARGRQWVWEDIPARLESMLDEVFEKFPEFPTARPPA
jgi:hypothetical protein